MSPVATKDAMSQASWLRAQNAAISIGCRVDAPIAVRDGWLAHAERTEQTDPEDPQKLRTVTFEGRGPTPDAALLALVEKLPGVITEPPRMQRHCATCTCQL